MQVLPSSRMRARVKRNGGEKQKERELTCYVLFNCGRSMDRVNLFTIITWPSSFTLHAASNCWVPIQHQLASRRDIVAMVNLSAAHNAKPTVTQIRSSSDETSSASEYRDQNCKQTTRMDICPLQERKGKEEISRLIRTSRRNNIRPTLPAVSWALDGVYMWNLDGFYMGIWG